MIRIKEYLITCLGSIALVLSACTDDELIHFQKRVVEGIPTRVTLPFGVNVSPVYTRAAVASEYEYRVENLYVFVFDSNGNRVWTKDAPDGNNKAFFDAFFKDGGPYLRYAIKTLPDGNDDILRYDRKNYKVGVVVTVQYEDLRKALEQQGVISSLTSGFAK